MKYYDDSLIGWGIDYLFIWSLGKDKNKYILVDDISVINPDDEKNNIRELNIIDGVNDRVKKWNIIKNKYNIPNWEHKSHKTINKIY